MSRGGKRTSAARHIAVYIPSLAGGGAETSMLRLCETLLSEGYGVDLVVNRKAGSSAARVPTGIRVVELRRQNKLRARWTALRAAPEDWYALWRPVILTRKPIMALPYLAALADYLGENRPQVMISALFYANLLAIWARELARVETRLIVSVHNTLSHVVAARGPRAIKRGRWRHLPALLARVYPRSDAIVAVSHGVAADLVAMTGLPRRKFTVIYNPVVWPGLTEMARAGAGHPWLAAVPPPVIMAAGRLADAKDYPTLIAAFAQVRANRAVRLLILGEGELQATLEARIAELGLENDVALCGWVDNPYAHMARASVFVLSSAWEGLGNVLIEAMACGCPVVATDCPSGPREILAAGRYGPLVPVGDVERLARAIEDTLEQPIDAAILRRRADDFSVAAAASAYRALIEKLIEGGETL